MALAQDLVEKRGTLKKKQEDLAAIFKEAGPDRDFSKITLLDGDTVQKAKAIRDRDTEINVLADEVKALVDATEAADAQKRREETDEDGLRKGFRHRGDHHADEAEDYGVKRLESYDIGKMFAESDGLKKISGGHGPVASFQVDMKTLMTTAAGYAPEVTRTGLVVPLAVRPIQVIDLFPMGRTSQTSVKFMKETVLTNNAAEIAEAGTYPESAIQLAEDTSPVQKIGTFLPVTDEQLEDIEGIQSYINNRLMYFVRSRFDSQLLVGNGTTPNLRGLLNVSGIQTTAVTGGEPVADAIYRAMINVMVTGRAQPSGVIFNPLDWMDVKLSRTADGIYIWGNPSDVSPNRIWGLPVALTDALTQNTAVVGDFANFTEINMKRDLELQFSNSHSTYFIEGKQAIRADMRAAFVVYRPAAISTVTNV